MECAMVEIAAGASVDVTVGRKVGVMDCHWAGKSAEWKAEKMVDESAVVTVVERVG